MRKVKEIAKDVESRLNATNNEDECVEVIASIIREFMNDFLSVYKQRRISENGNMRGFISLIREINNRWNSLCILCPYFNIDGFKKMMFKSDHFKKYDIENLWSKYYGI